ncbi:azolemycin family RiPP peptide [Streptomyces sulphureus]|nr:azolemycin family RiPP peptide [Streptomyces sulphureus]
MRENDALPEEMTIRKAEETFAGRSCPSAAPSEAESEEE